jgi:hypothetical protein
LEIGSEMKMQNLIQMKNHQTYPDSMKSDMESPHLLCQCDIWFWASRHTPNMILMRSRSDLPDSILLRRSHQTLTI